MKIFLRRHWVSIVILLVVALGIGGFFAREKLLWWYARYSVYRMTVGLPRCDRAEVYLLGIRDYSRSDQPGVVYPTATQWDGGSAILDLKRLINDDAEKLAATWRKQRFSYEDQGMCHEPVYGLRFFMGERVKFEGTLCFHCHNFYTKFLSIFGIHWGFDAETPEGRELWRELDTAVPYALRKPLEDAIIAEKKARQEEEAARHTSGQKP